MIRPAMERFKSFCEFDPGTGCVLWTGYRYKGYGYFWYGPGRGLAHRWAALNIHGLPLEPDLDVDHICRNRRCQQHLRLLPAPINRRWTEAWQDETWMEIAEQEFCDVPFFSPPTWLL